jgi:AcrR family transcriptional regulator
MAAEKRKSTKRARPKRAVAKRAAAAQPYHHGDLREKLITATEALILERGVDGFSLREVARRAGVSPAAPAHHFGDTKGLLSEVARLGFEDFGDALHEADLRGGNDPAKRLNEQGIAYVSFALRNPARFTLMFRHDKYDMANKALHVVAERAFGILESAIRAAEGLAPTDEMTQNAYGLMLATWSIVHGFAHLALGGELDFAAQSRGGKTMILKSFLPLTLKHLPIPTPRK